LHILAVLLAAAFAGPSWRALVVGVACAQSVAVAGMLYAAERSAGERSSSAAVSAFECYSYGLRIKWAEVMKLLGGRADLLIVAAMLNRFDVGAYSLAIAFREFGMTPLRTYAGILQNLLVDRRRKRDDDRDLVIGSLLLQATISLALTGVVALLLPLGIPLVYGARFADAATPATLLFSSTIFVSAAGLCWTVFNMRGRPELTSSIVTLSGVVGPLTVWLMTRRFGVNGAAAAGLVSAAVVCAVSLVVLGRFRNYSIRDVVTVARQVPALARTLGVTALLNVGRMSPHSAAERS
jgi:O-antigen/teichoic acid export membrane protein